MYTPRKPPPPTNFEIFKQDNWAIGAVVIPAILAFTSLYIYFTTPDYQRDSSFWQVFDLFFFLPIILAVPFLYWRVPRRAKRIRQIWEAGDFIIGEVQSVEQGGKNMPNILHYTYTYNGETYEKRRMVGRMWRPRASMEIGLIVVPDKPDEVIITDLY
jgi:hypothetical protein